MKTLRLLQSLDLRWAKLKPVRVYIIFPCSRNFSWVTVLGGLTHGPCSDSALTGRAFLHGTSARCFFVNVYVI